MTTDRIIIILACIAGLMLALFTLKECSRPDHYPEPEKAEATINREPVLRVDFAEKEAAYVKQIKALQSDLAAAKGKATTTQAKARQSASKYAETAKHEDCSKALADCQQHSEALIDVVQIQDKQLNASDSLAVLTRSELDRSYAVNDTLTAAVQDCGAELAKAERKIKRKNGLLKVAGSVITALVAVVLI